VFFAEKSAILAGEIYSVPIGGGTVTNLSGAPVSGGSVLSYFQVSPDSTRVAFVADKTTAALSELYSVPIGGGAATKLSGLLVSGGQVFANFQVSSDSARVMFIADKIADTVDELFLVQIGGTALALDVDGDDKVLALTDLLMLTRYQLGMRGSALIQDALGVNATRSSASSIETFIAKALRTPALP
jgi:hypothetical protein